MDLHEMLSDMDGYVIEFSNELKYVIGTGFKIGDRHLTDEDRNVEVYVRWHLSHDPNIGKCNECLEEYHEDGSS